MNIEHNLCDGCMKQEVSCINAAMTDCWKDHISQASHMQLALILTTT